MPLVTEEINQTHCVIKINAPGTAPAERTVKYGAKGECEEYIKLEKANKKLAAGEQLELHEIVKDDPRFWKIDGPGAPPASEGM